MRTIIFLFVLTFCLNISCRQASIDLANTRDIDFSDGWYFLEDSTVDASAPSFEDAGWRVVDLPHDWSVEDFPEQDSVHVGPFIKSHPLGHDVGYLRGGAGWYRKQLILEKRTRGKQVFIHFDGVHTEMTLWVNGKEVGSHVNGYTPFYFNITPYLQPDGEQNLLTIKVNKPVKDSRWFTGAGIYRQVTISYLHPVHISPWGVFVKTTLPGGNNQAQVDLDIAAANTTSASEEILLRTDIYNAEHALVARDEIKVAIPAHGTVTTPVTLQIKEPVLWELDNPVMYYAKVSVEHGGAIIDTYRQSFGIRTISYSADSGLLLNGKEILLKGACMHHDNGLLGAAAFKGAEERRVRIMKNNGYNAIRTAHNPPSKFFLDACDRIGMLVVDESFDMWVKPKRPNDYHRHFKERWNEDLTNMVLRDRNHPSVIMWSFGNEVQERADSLGIEIAKNCIALIKSLDDTRPVTQAICGFWDNPGLQWHDSAPAFGYLDIGGYNYQWDQYEDDHHKYPERVMYGSESFPMESYEYWKMVEKYSWVIGDFVWTGMDYIGESGIGHTRYVSDKNAEKQFYSPWPVYVGWCGDLDITGNKKPQSYYRDVLWGESKLEMMVHEPIPPGMVELPSAWGWPAEEPHWNWPGSEGRMLDVRVFSSYPVVRLELNGRLIAEKSISESDKLIANFRVPYEPGALRALALIDANVMDSKQLVTAGQISQVRLNPENEIIIAGKGELAFLQLSGLDGAGNVVPDAANLINVTVNGPATLLAAGNGGPNMNGSLQDAHLNLFRGLGQIIIRSSGQPGEIKVSVESKDINGDTATIKAVILQPQTGR